MNNGDKIFITGGKYESARATVLNVLDNGKVIVRIGGVDVMVHKKDYVKIGGVE